MSTRPMKQTPALSSGKELAATLLRNAFYAQAIADAIGGPFEFGNYTVKEVRAFIEDDSPINLTDDTQMAMFGQEAINLSKSLEDLPAQIESAYIRWYGTQLHPPVASFGLAARKEMQVRRAPGARCMSSLATLSAGRPLQAADGKGCGPVMRLLPFADLYFEYNAESVQSIAEISCCITHTHPEAIEATNRYMKAALFLMEGGDRTSLGMTGSSINSHGQGWLADECVAMALWAVQHAKDYGHLLELCIAQPGDSDSVAAVAGGLWGLAGLNGYESQIGRLVEQPCLNALLAK